MYFDSYYGKTIRHFFEGSSKGLKGLKYIGHRRVATLRLEFLLIKFYHSPLVPRTPESRDSLGHCKVVTLQRL